jgi:hypothetical protein
MANGTVAVGEPGSLRRAREAVLRRVRTVSAGLLVLGVLCGTWWSAAASTITLRDGSSISGEVVSLHDGVYTIQSPALGTVTVKQADVRTLAEPAAASVPAQLDALREHLAADPATMDAITALASDPDVQAILGDPQVRAALQDGNLDALLSNPNIARLAADPRIRGITEKFMVGVPAAGGSSH